MEADERAADVLVAPNPDKRIGEMTTRDGQDVAMPQGPHASSLSLPPYVAAAVMLVLRRTRCCRRRRPPCVATRRGSISSNEPAVMRTIPFAQEY